MPNPVVVTRPLAQAERLAAGIAALGRQAILFPLLEIHPLADVRPLLSALQNLGHYGMVAFVSPNAIHSVFSRIDSWPQGVPIGIVGEGSRNALAEHGITAPAHTIFSPTDPDHSDSEGLLAVLDIQKLGGKPVLIVRGESGRELLADELRAHGIQVEQVAAYRRSVPVLDSNRRDRLTALIRSEHDWIVTSSEAMRNLVQMTKETAGDAGVQKLQQQTFFVPHARIETTARELGFGKLILTVSGDAGLLAALQCRP
ncbi:uroporphyrinogen-III synthase [Oxalobacteraceae bacterium R-40]|uniref:Uroporphyrinogen-III synthase n=1 Tax=Keguizhuia sedimenti TaxID=3064264 RepID=A0ABU1BN61_9BURK|nr:uroporphyrinogen-III synthase [Oxalobacteraceae bacterium R-40]